MEEATGQALAPTNRAGAIDIAIVGGGLRATSVLRLLTGVDGLGVVAVFDPNRAAPGMRLAEDLGIFTTTDLSDFCQVPSLDLILDLSDEPGVRAALEVQCPSGVGVVSGVGAELVWDLLVAKKRSDEQERIFVELQVAYDKIRSHERRLQSSKEALERANEQLESRLAEIFFTHEFFKALTCYSSIDDVASLIVDGANGILGAEISAVYLIDEDAEALRLRGSQGRPEGSFRQVIPITESILAAALKDDVIEQPEVSGGSPDASWAVHAEEIRSQVAIALRSGDATLGALVVASSTPRELTAAEHERLQGVANQSSLALQNALLHDELERLSVTDRLTELYNHGYFHQRLDEELGRAARFGRRLSLILLDIDDFKKFNDMYLHPQGDQVLRAVSAIIRQNLREIDVAARYGGEEFCVVLPETDIAGAAAVAERIRAGVARHLFPTGRGGETVHQTVSVGVATYPTHASSGSSLIEAADKAMYRAKRGGKNRVDVAG